MYPYALTQESAETYRNYIKEHGLEAAQKFIREDDKDKLTFLVDLGVLDSSETDKAIDLALALDKTEFTAFLMDYKHRNFSMAEESFDL